MIKQEIERLHDLLNGIKSVPERIGQGGRILRVLVACEESQAVCKAFRRLGHEAYSCDIQPCSGGRPEWHIQADALEIIKIKWDLIIAHPPCTYLSNAGNRWLYQGGTLNLDRYYKGLQAKDFFLQFFTADCPKIAVENPIPNKIYGLPPCSQRIQPWQFGHPLTKCTCLWLRGLPPLAPTDVVQPVDSAMPSSHSGKNGVLKHDSKSRSKTFPGIAAAMADQWGGK